MRIQVCLIRTFRLGLRASRVATVPVVALSWLCALALQTAAAQNEPADFCTNGQLMVLRVSRIIETGSRSGFDQAVSDQAAWYRSHGFTANRLVTADIITEDPKAKTWSKSATEVLSLHINPPPMTAIKPDLAWNGFVSKFKSNSIVESERTACLEQPLD